MANWCYFLGISFAGSDDDLSMDQSPGNELNKDWAYCFRFSWLGPKFDKDSDIQNKTCKTEIGSAKGIPCVQPLVATGENEFLWIFL